MIQPIQFKSSDPLHALQYLIRSQENAEKAAGLKRFFKTGPHQYGEGDVFLGLTVPQIRDSIKSYLSLSLVSIQTLLRSDYHEERLAGLLILVHQFKKGHVEVRQVIFRFYINHLERVNNWDLVDSSADKIVGGYYLSNPKEVSPILYKLAHSPSLWERRVAMVATFELIKEKKPELCFQIAKLLLHDSQDLIHKAVGWMLREVGKRCSEDSLRTFLRDHKDLMPRTALRYAIERFSKEERAFWLQ